MCHEISGCVALSDALLVTYDHFWPDFVIFSPLLILCYIIFIFSIDYQYIVCDYAEKTI